MNNQCENYSNSTTTLPGLNDLSSIIGNSISDTITNTIGDIINSETVQNNMGNEAITVTAPTPKDALWNACKI